MKKRVISFVLALFMVWTCISGLTVEASEVMKTTAVASEQSGTQGTISWNLSEDGVLTISGTGTFSSGMIRCEDTSVIKKVIIEEGITSIGASAFKGYTGIEEVELPDGLVSIQSWAFQSCTSLKEIVIPEGVTSVKAVAFTNCTSLTSVRWMSEADIPANAFNKCSKLTDVVIKEGVESIGETAFNECHALESITIPSSVTEIGKQAFAYCSELRNITLQNGLTTIGLGAFSYCEALTEIELPDSISSIGSSAFANSGLTEITLPNGVKTVPASIFFNCVNLTAVTLPNTVTSIGDSAFEGCKSLVKIELPDSITTLGTKTFYQCNALSEVNLPDNLTSIGQVLFGQCHSLVSMTVPASLNKLNVSMFIGCEKLKEVIVLGEITKIPSMAFADCVSLETVVLPTEGIKEIGSYAFEQCEMLTEEDINFLNDVETIEYYAFLGCDGIKSVTLDEEVTSIGSLAFPVTTEIVTYCGSTAHSYAKEKGNPVKILDGSAHTYEDKEITVEPTCTKEGVKVQACIHCGVEKEASVPMTDHTEGKWIVEVAPTCWGKGTLSTSCTSCGTKMYAYEPAYGHAYGEIVKVIPSTCVTNGTGTRTCSRCGDVMTIALAYGDHTHGEWEMIQEPGCETKGLRIQKCIYCSDTIEEDVDPTGHHYSEWVVETPNGCGTEGLKVQTCSGCGDRIEEVLAAKVHAYSEWTEEKEASCTDEGLKVQVCANCGDRIEEILPVLGHEWKDSYTVDKKAACGVKGSKSIHCKSCDAIKSGSTVTIDALEHSYKKTTTKATTSKNGSIVKKCEYCGKKTTTTIYYPKTVTLSKTKYTYTGNAVKPSVTVKDSNGNTISSSYYTVTYASGRKVPGTYNVTIAFKTNYSGKITKSFTIAKASQTISASNKKLIVGADATALGAKRTKGNGKLTYTSSNKNVVTVSSAGKLTPKAAGTATITITAAATSCYNKATKKVTVTVNPKGTTLSSVSSAKNGQLTVKWKKGSSITGYQIRYSLKSSMDSSKTAKITKAATVTKTLTGLTKGKKYYVQIRTYKTTGGKKYYSAWSKAKSASVLNVKLSASEADVRKGQKITLKITGTSKSVTWKTSNKSIATVSSKGVVTGKKIGKATITATVGGQKFTCKVNVTNLYTDKNPHFTAKLIGETGKTYSWISVTVTNKGHKELTIGNLDNEVEMCWFYPYGLDYHEQGFLVNSNGAKISCVKIAPGATKTINIRLNGREYMTSDSEIKFFFWYKNQEYFASISKNESESGYIATQKTK